MSLNVMGQILELTPPASRVTHDANVVERTAPAVRTTDVYVVFTAIEDTLAAVRIGSAFARSLSAQLTVIHFRTVPYALPLETPGGRSSVETAGFAERLRSAGIDVRVQVYLCRDARRAIPRAFRDHSFIVVGGHRRWWFTRAERWRRALERAGHFVLFVDEPTHKEKSRA